MSNRHLEQAVDVAQTIVNNAEATLATAQKLVTQYEVAVTALADFAKAAMGNPTLSTEDRAAAQFTISDAPRMAGILSGLRAELEQRTAAFAANRERLAEIVLRASKDQ